MDAGLIIFYVFLVGGAFSVVDRTGALARLVNSMVRMLSGRGMLVIPIAGLAFATGGMLIQMEEELIAFVPVLLLLTRRLGFRPMVAVAMSLGASLVAASFSPFNPFQVGIAQKVADLELASRLAVPDGLPGPRRRDLAGGHDAVRQAYPDRAGGVEEDAGPGAGWRHAAVLGVVLASFVVFVVGELKYGWDFDRLAVVFFTMGVLAGLIGGLGVTGTAEGFVDGFRAIAYAALLIGFARAIYVVMDQGQHRGHHRPRPVHARRQPACHRLGAGDDGSPHPGPPAGAEHQRPCGADPAGPGAAVGSDRAVPAGDRARLPVRRRAHQHALAHQRGLDGDARRRRGDLRRAGSDSRCRCCWASSFSRRWRSGWAWRSGSGGRARLRPGRPASPASGGRRCRRGGLAPFPARRRSGWESPGCRGACSARDWRRCRA